MGCRRPSATCIGIGGINIGTGCDSTFGNFALVLGTGTATAHGFFTAAIGTGTDITAVSDGLGTLAYAGGTGSLAETQGILNLAAAGFGFEGPLGIGPNESARAGLRNFDFVNIAVNLGSADDAPGSGGPATSTVEAGNGGFNLAGNLFGNANSGGAGGIPTPVTVLAGGDSTRLGFGTVAANVVGNRSHVEAIGTLLNATNWGNVFKTPQSADSTVTAGTHGSPTSLSWAFNYQGIFTEACDALCGNTVNATGPLSVAGAIGVVGRDVSQDGAGIAIATQLNDTGSEADVVAASNTPAKRVRLNSSNSKTNVPTQESGVRISLNPASDRPKPTSAGGSVRKSVTDRIASSTKKLKDTASKGTGKRAGGAKAGAASTSGGDKTTSGVA